MTALAAETADRFGGIDIVVPSAGGNDDEVRSTPVRGPFVGIDLERATAFVGEALGAKLRVVQAAVPFLRERGAGSVVFLTPRADASPPLARPRSPRSPAA